MITHIYSDGGLVHCSPSPYGGTWAWCHVNEAGQRVAEASGLILPRRSLPTITANLAELVAMVKALEALPDGWVGVAATDSHVTLARLFVRGLIGQIPRGLRAQIKAVALRIDLKKITPLQLDSHPTASQLLAGRGKNGRPVSLHNVWCDEACSAEARRHLAELRAQGFAPPPRSR